MRHRCAAPALHEAHGGRILGSAKTCQPGARMDFDKELDARGLNCPLPILRTKKSLNDMVSGQVLRVVATDPGSFKYFHPFSKQTGTKFLPPETPTNEFVFFIK